MKKKILIISVIFVILLSSIITIILLNNPKYKDDYTPIELYIATAHSFITKGGMNILEDDIILEFVDEKPSYLEEYAVLKANLAKNINEIGIFKVQNDKTDDMKKLVEIYINKLQSSYRAMNYFPEETEKIDCATVKVFGNYVIYSFLNEKDTKAFYRSVKSNLKK